MRQPEADGITMLANGEVRRHGAHVAPHEKNVDLCGYVGVFWS
jgi:hypothetical protein